jgi:predicted ATP-dependent endonuclease of OLD family
MKLRTVHVKNFKSIRDSQPFTVDERVTCLVGKNESGKTALLQALNKCNPVVREEADFDFDLEYPRASWDEGVEGEAGEALITTWELDPTEIEAFQAALGPGSLRSPQITITKGYFEVPVWSIDFDEAAMVRHFVGQVTLDKDVRDSLLKRQKVADVMSALEANSQRSTGEQELLTALTAAFPERKGFKGALKIVHGFVPHFVYIPEFFRLPGQIALNDLKTRIATPKLTREDRVFLALLDMVGAKIDTVEAEGEFERLNARLETASNKISQRIFKYWSQNRHLIARLRFDHSRPQDPAPFNSGYVFRTRIENTRHHVTVSFDERSAGFVWFFSFLVWFSQAKKTYGNRLIILLDEPGLSLHAKAQADLLRYFEEELAPNHQVVYSTHSPFMIDPAHLERVRTVEDVFVVQKDNDPPIPESELGTKVGDQVLSTDRDTVFPLQAALGYEITQTLFVGENTLLVEGPSEILYLQWFSKRLGAEGLDRRWTICPCGGIDKIPAFLSLFGGNRLHVAVLTDFASGQKKKVEDLRRSSLLGSGHVLTCDTFAGQAEADIEDVVGRASYVELVNRTYELKDRPLPAKAPKDVPARVVKEVEQHFALLPPEAPNFDHFDPASYLIQQKSDTKLPGIDAAEKAFKALFAAINALLPLKK